MIKGFLLPAILLRGLGVGARLNGQFIGLLTSSSPCKAVFVCPVSTCMPEHMHVLTRTANWRHLNFFYREREYSLATVNAIYISMGRKHIYMLCIAS